MVEVTGIGALTDRVAGFSSGMGVVGLARGRAVLTFSNGTGVIGVGWDVAAAGFSDGTGLFDLADVLCAMGSCACWSEPRTYQHLRWVARSR